MRKFLEKYCLKIRYISGYKRCICSELTKRQKIDRVYSYLTECAKIVDKPINNITIVCLGTDRCIGDSLGPIVGHLLVKENLDINIVGTLSKPMHAGSIVNKLYEIDYNNLIISIDATVSHYENELHLIQVLNKPIRPGLGLGKDLPSIGDISVVGTTYIKNNPNENKDDTVSGLSKVRIFDVLEIAEIIAAGILKYLKYTCNKKSINLEICS